MNNSSSIDKNKPVNSSDGKAGAAKPNIPSVLNKQINFHDLFIYQKSDVLYQLAFSFCDRFIHLYKDRTRDQVIQAARSCKQNIVEGLSDGVTSTEMQMKLLNVARSSNLELREDFEDYIKSRHLKFYGFPPKDDDEEEDKSYYDCDCSKFDLMLQYCRSHNRLKDYDRFFPIWTDEEMCNYGITLCRIVDKGMMSFMQGLDKKFVTEGGIKERMYKARTGYRQAQDERLKFLEEEYPLLLKENQLLKEQVVRLQQDLLHAADLASNWKDKYNDLKERALKSYYAQQEEIKDLKEQLNL